MDYGGIDVLAKGKILLKATGDRKFVETHDRPGPEGAQHIEDHKIKISHLIYARVRSYRLWKTLVSFYCPKLDHS